MSSAIYLAMALTFSSTIIIVKLLAEKKDTESVYGRYTIGVMVVQDLVAIFIMMVVTSVGKGNDLWLEIGTLVGKIFILLGFVGVMARYVVPKILDKVAKSDEFLFIFTITWCFGIASLLYWMGFSLEIGAIIAGLTLGSSPYQSEIASRIKPLRDFFIIIFFIILGSEMSLANISNIWGVGVILSIFILLGNPFILYSVFRALKFTRRNSFLSGVTAAQVSEFGFVLLIVGRNSGHIAGTELEVFTIVALITIITSSYIITYNGQVFDFLKPLFDLFGADKHRQKEELSEKYDVLVFGYHRIGWKVCEALAEKEIKYAVVDYNPEAVKRLKSRNIPAFFGDVRDVEFLETLPLNNAKMIVSTIPDHDDQLTLFKHVRKTNKKIILIGNLYHNTYLDDLYESGANYVMMTHLLGGQWISDIIKGSPWTEKTFNDLRKEQKQEMQLRFTSGVRNLN
jgi:Kef-type K+ transport system membrane component KefB